MITEAWPDFSAITNPPVFTDWLKWTVDNLSFNGSLAKEVFNVLGYDPATQSQLSGVWGVVQTLSTSVVKPVALTVLSLIALFELINISAAGQTDPNLGGAKPVILLFFKYIVVFYALDHVTDFAKAFFALAGDIMSNLKSNSTLNGYSTQNSPFGSVTQNLPTGWGALFPALMLSIPALATMAVTAMILAQAWGRFIEIYMLVACGSLPIVFFCNSKTRAWGESYVRTLGSAVFKSVTLYMGIKMYLAIQGSLIGKIDSFNQLYDGAHLPKLICSIILLFSITSAGNKVADAIFGK